MIFRTIHFAGSLSEEDVSNCDVRRVDRNLSRTVSRVLSGMIIYLGLTLPTASSDLPEDGRASLNPLFGLASDGVYTASSVTG